MTTSNHAIKKKSVVIVGGGPVGLFLAAGLSGSYVRQQLGIGNVTLYEKRTSYSRDQILLLNYDTVWLLSEDHDDFWSEIMKAGACFTTPPPLGSKGICAPRPVGFEDQEEWAGAGGPYYSIPTKNFEMAMMKVAKQRGVTVIHRAPTQAELKAADILVGSEGAGGELVPRYMKSKKRTMPQFASYGLGMTYTPKKRKPPLPVSPTDGMKYNTDWKNRQHRRRYFTASGNSKYYLGLQISKSQYVASKNAKTVCDLPPGLRKRVTINLKHVGDQPVESCFNVFAFPIIPQMRSPFIKKVGKSQIVALIGDSAFTSHFFSGLGVNNGLAMANHFIWNMGQLAQSPHLTLEKTMDRYVRDVLDIQRKNMFFWKLVMLNPEKVLKMCSSVSDKKLRDLAAANHVDIKHLNRQEICLTLGPIRLQQGPLSVIGKGNMPFYYSPVESSRSGRGARHLKNDAFTFDGLERFSKNYMYRVPASGGQGKTKFITYENIERQRRRSGSGS